VIIEVFVAQSDPMNTLGDQGRQPMVHVTLIPQISKATAEPGTELQALINFPKKQGSAIAGEVASRKIRLHFAPSQGLKLEFGLTTLCLPVVLVGVHAFVLNTNSLHVRPAAGNLAV
jgi:hypothetical protein